MADAITRFTGSMRFVYLHVVLYDVWLIVNLGVAPEVPKFDPFLYLGIGVVRSRASLDKIQALYSSRIQALD